MLLQDVTVETRAATLAPECAEVLAGRVLARVGDDPFFVGSALVAYQHCAGADLRGVAAFLGCPMAALPRVALARRPDPHGPRFMAEIGRIAAHAGAKRDRIAAVLQFWYRKDR